MGQANSQAAERIPAIDAIEAAAIVAVALYGWPAPIGDSALRARLRHAPLR